MDPPPYKASGWLGIITAGALWSPLFDAGSLDTGIQLLMKQIRLAMPESGADVGTAEPTMEEQDGELFTVDEMRSEVSAGCSWLQVQLFCVFVFCVLYFVFSLCDPAQLDRLRANLEEASITKKPKLVDPTGPCGLPAGVHGGTAFPRCAPSPSNVTPTFIGCRRAGAAHRAACLDRDAAASDSAVVGDRGQRAGGFPWK